MLEFQDPANAVSKENGVSKNQSFGPIADTAASADAAISYDTVAKMLDKERVWVRNNFFPTLIDTLTKSGFPVDIVKQNEDKIKPQLEKFLTGLSLGRSQFGGYAEKLGDSTAIFYDRVEEKARSLKKEDPKLSHKELEERLSVFLRDTVVHEAVHGLQPENSLLPPKELFEGGAELLSNMMLSSLGQKGKVTYQSYLPILAETLSGNDSTARAKLRQQFIQYSVLGFLQNRTQTQILIDSFESALGQVKGAYDGRADAVRKLLGFDFPNNANKTPEISQEGLRLLANGAYSSPEKVSLNLREYFKDAYEKEQQRNKQSR